MATTRLFRDREVIEDIGFVEVVYPKAIYESEECRVCQRRYPISWSAPEWVEIWDVYSGILEMPISRLPKVIRAIGSGVYLLKEIVPDYLRIFPNATFIEPSWLRRNYPYRKRIAMYTRIREDQVVTLIEAKSQFAYTVTCRECKRQTYGFLHEEMEVRGSPNQERLELTKFPITKAEFVAEERTTSGLYSWKGTTLATSSFVEWLTLATGKILEPPGYDLIAQEPETDC
ncbi:MAG: hypothetical protein ABL949_11925 [Fimbriimonadaceae bacterium]